MSLIPTQIDDAESAESVYNYTLTDGSDKVIKESNDLEEIMDLINDPKEGPVFTIIVNHNDTITSRLVLDTDKEVTLTSSSDGPFTLTKSYTWHFWVGGTLTLKNITLEGDKDKGDIYGILVKSSGTLIMEKGAVIQNFNSYDEGGGVYNAGIFNMNDGKIIGNTAFFQGAGVYNEGRFTMKGGEISGNNVEIYGGGVFNSYSGTFILEKGEISGNIAGFSGGGVFNDNIFTMSGKAVISGNTSVYNGGGVYNSGGTFDMKDGVISGNKAIGTERGGGGVCNSVGTFIMSNGEISGNTAELGGGVYSNDRGTTNITGGKIIGNTATGTDEEKGSGGGIYTEDYTKLTVKPADEKEVVFSGNTAPTLRTKNIDDDAVLANYANISDKVVLSEPASYPENKKAPAYNNYDINYPGDSYVVTIDIIPNGGGTITATSEGEGIVHVNGYVYVPLTNDEITEITLSAIPKSGGKFVQFEINKKEFSEDSIVVEVKGNVTVSVEFLLMPAQPEHKDYSINASADSGSEITPSGTVKVLYGHDGVFKFSAKPGYKITAVKVNGDPISSAELASGEYTFRNVKSNHTIEVVSEADDGSGGGSDVGAGGSGGNETGSGRDADGGWSVLSMICAILALITGMIAVAAGKDRFRTDNEEKRSGTGMTLRVLALVIGVVSVAAFFLVEDLALSPAAFSEWTLLMFILFFAALILAIVSFRFDKTDG